jgi:hypothetical protein
MAIRQITPLPSAPSRASDPVNFVNESALFLSALPSFQTQTNLFITDVNLIKGNKFNFGLLSSPISTFPSFPTFNGTATGTGIAYVSSIDTLYEALQNRSTLVNSVATWLDDFSAYQGVVSTDASKPSVSTLSVPHNRSQGQAAFNTSAIAFTTSSNNFINSLNTLIQYDTNFWVDDDYGLVTDGTISMTIDCGTITDSTITN